MAASEVLMSVDFSNKGPLVQSCKLKTMDKQSLKRWNKS